jgi:mannitol/fructose-specific phosphotransferase system IIA component (Ntr-type)
MSLPALPPEAIRLGVEAADWQAAVRAAGAALAAAGFAKAPTQTR